MKPMMAVTLMMAKMNSASPYALTPKRLMATIARRKIVTKMDLLRCSFQYEIV